MAIGRDVESRHCNLANRSAKTKRMQVVGIMVSLSLGSSSLVEYRCGGSLGFLGCKSSSSSSLCLFVTVNVGVYVHVRQMPGVGRCLFILGIRLLGDSPSTSRKLGHIHDRRSMPMVGMMVLPKPCWVVVLLQPPVLHQARNPSFWDLYHHSLCSNYRSHLKTMYSVGPLRLA